MAESEPARGDTQFTLSLIVTTLGRRDELIALFDSLAKQDFGNFEVIVVDQNNDERLADVVRNADWPFCLTHLRTPGMRGASRGRNAGAKVATGSWLLFPDDDCWYPPWFLTKALNLAEETGAHVISGRASDEAGRSINGRFHQEPQTISRRNVWLSGVEWVMLIRRSTFNALNGYNELFGVGAETPWQANEMQELLLRAIEGGFSCVYRPDLFGYHAELDTRMPSRATALKGYQYARGMGQLLRVARFGPLTAMYWVSRPVFQTGLALVRLNVPRARYYANIASGRLRGYLDQPHVSSDRGYTHQTPQRTLRHDPQS